MGRIDDLVKRRQLVVDEPQQVTLRFPMQRKPRFVQQQDDGATCLLHLCKFYKEGEEPDKARTSFREGRVDAMQVVSNASSCDGALVVWRWVARACRVDAHLHVEVGILRPVLEYLVGDVGRCRLQHCVEGLVRGHVRYRIEFHTRVLKKLREQPRPSVFVIVDLLGLNPLLCLLDVNRVLDPELGHRESW